MRVDRASTDVEAFRTVRLRSLAADPWAFGSTLDREQAFTPAVWAERSAQAFLASSDGDVVVGLAGWFWTEPDVVADLVMMWVDPSARGRGVGTALVAAVVDDVVTRAGGTLELGVVADNGPATRLYRSLGFLETGRQTGERSGEQLIRMRWGR